MSDYYSAEQLANRLGLSLEELQQAQACGLIRPVRKNGSVFYSSHHAYRLKAACQLRRKQRLNWEEAAAELGKRPLYHVSSR